MHFAALNVKNTYLFYVLCRFLVLISVFLYLFPFSSGQNKYYLFGLALVAVPAVIVVETKESSARPHKEPCQPTPRLLHSPGAEHETGS